MKTNLSDWRRSCLAAIGMLGLAASVVFEIPHGFEEQLSIYFILLPGVFALLFAAAFEERDGRESRLLAQHSRPMTQFKPNLLNRERVIVAQWPG